MVKGSSCCAWAGSFMWLVALSDLPNKLSPVVKPLCHPVLRRELPIGSLPGQFTAFEAAEQTTEAFCFSLLQPFFVLQMAFIIGCLLCFFELVCNGVKHQFCCVEISVFQPVVTGV